MKKLTALALMLFPLMAVPQVRVVQTRAGGRPLMVFVQGTSCDAASGGTSAVCTWATALTAGNLVVGACALDAQTSTITVSDVNGNYTSEGTVGTGTSPGKIEAFSVITAGGATTTTCNQSGGATGVVMILGEFTNPANPLAGDASVTQLQASTTTPNPGSISLTNTSSIFVFAWQNTLSSFTSTAGSGYTRWSGTNITNGTHGSVASDGMMAQYILSTPAGSTATAFGTSTSNTWNSIAVPIQN